MLRKLKFYIIGFVPGLLIVFFILNKKGSSCSYFPNNRVIAEVLTKDFSYSENFKIELQKNNISEKFLKDSIITKGNIDFSRSKAQKQPCPEYLLSYPKENPKIEIYFSKCKETAQFIGFKRLR